MWRAQTGLEETNPDGGVNARMCNAEGDLMPVGQAWLYGSNADCGVVPPPSPPTPPLPPPPSPPPNHPAWCPELLEIATAAGRSYVKELADVEQRLLLVAGQSYSVQSGLPLQSARVDDARAAILLARWRRQ